MSDEPEPGSKSKTSSSQMIRDFGKSNARSQAALEAFGKQVASLDLDGDLEAGVVDEPLPQGPEPTLDADHGQAEFELEPEPALELDTQRAPDPNTEHHAEPATPDRPNLEPVGDDAHPPHNRRIATQPPGALQLALESAPTKKYESLTAAAARGSDASAPTTPSPQQRAAPGIPTTRGPSPSPVRERRWLFSDDRLTNLLAGAAIGLTLVIFPAKKLARGYEIREVEPMLAELDGAIDHPLGVEAGLVERPEQIAAKIHAGRTSTRRRYVGIWLLVGLPIGLGLGLVPRPGG